MKKYDLVIFGSTFYAAGICSAYKGSTLVVEPKTKPGYEFIDAYHPGSILEYTSISKEAKEFSDFLHLKKLTHDAYILRWTPYLSEMMLHTSADYLFLTDILNVRKSDEGYVVTIFNTMGKSEICAQRIIDTRATDLGSKTINFLTKGDAPLSENEDLKLIMEYEDYSIYERKINIDDDYPSARKKVVESFTYLKSLCDNISLVSIADEFYKRAAKAQTEISVGYLKCASSYYDNPIEAYDMGARKGEEIQ
ncbi:MAG: hypothetical protein E7396_02685 [Ruminococcaceae bacterium]|nr:hypothetical protein [Oscillospiraceae bacterium]